MPRSTRDDAYGSIPDVAGCEEYQSGIGNLADARATRCWHDSITWAHAGNVREVVRGLNAMWSNTVATLLGKISNIFSSFTAAVVGTAVLWPMFALVAALSLYFQGIGRICLLTAPLIGLVIWIIIAFWYRRFTCVRTANTAVYQDLMQAFIEVASRIPNGLPNPDEKSSETIAYRQALAHKITIENQVSEPHGSLRWMTASGYINLWKSLHRMEESLIYFDTEPDVVADAFIDKWRLTGSALDGANEILVTLHDALVGLGIAKGMGATAMTPPPSRPQARAYLSKVRFAINDFRDTRREGLVRARNRLLATAFVAGIVTNVLLALIILATPDGSVGRAAVMTAAILFFVGAIIGLFNRLYLDGQSETGIEDYALSTARLIATPLLSGIAAVGGVLVSVLLPIVLNGNIPTPKVGTATPTIIMTATPSAAATMGSNTTVTPTSTAAVTASEQPHGSLVTPSSVPLHEVFDVQQYPFEVVLAAVFALAPGVLLNRLRQQGEKFKADLASTQASQTSPSR